jgi:hypothetical protein
LALADGSEAIGVVRATRLTDAIPHPELIGRVLQDPRFCLDIGSCATANSLAVSLQHRGVRQEIAGKTRPMTVGKALICEIADWLRGEGCQAILLTTARAVSAVFFEHLGFYVIETHVKVEGMGTDFVTMGCVLDDYCRFDQKRSPMIENCPPRPLADPVKASRDFMAEQHHRLLGGASIEVFVFGAAEPDARRPRRSGTPP